MSLSQIKVEPKQMSVEDIIAADIEKNHRGSNLTVKKSYEILASAINDGEKLKRSGNTLFLVKELGDGGIEFHTINGERGETLVKNANAFFDDLKQSGYLYAETYFDNLKINELFKKINYEATVEKVDDGEFRTYKATVRL